MGRLHGLKKNAKVIFLIVLVLSGCRGRSNKGEKSTDSKKITVRGEILKPNESFVVIKEETLIVEVAYKPEEKMRGLMYREELQEDHGMLFVYDEEKILSFWMKNTPIPLSIAFISKEGVIVDIQDMEPLTTTSHRSKKPAKFALEVRRGWFKKRGIEIGDTVKLPLILE